MTMPFSGSANYPCVRPEGTFGSSRHPYHIVVSLPPLCPEGGGAKASRKFPLRVKRSSGRMQVAAHLLEESLPRPLAEEDRLPIDTPKVDTTVDAGVYDDYEEEVSKTYDLMPGVDGIYDPALLLFSEGRGVGFFVLIQGVGISNEGA